MDIFSFTGIGESLIQLTYSVEIIIILLCYTQETDQSVLLFTAKYGNIEIVELLLEKGADVHKNDKVFHLMIILC